MPSLFQRSARDSDRRHFIFCEGLIYKITTMFLDVTSAPDVHHVTLLSQPFVVDVWYRVAIFW